MDEIINVIIKLVATLLGVGLAYLGKLIASWIKAKFEERELQQLKSFVSTLVAAAEQIYKGIDDAGGKARLEYVANMLAKSGYEVTDKVRALIESNVFEINMLLGTMEGGNDGGH